MLLVYEVNALLYPHLAQENDQSIGGKNGFKVVCDNLWRLKFLQFQWRQFFEGTISKGVNFVENF